MDSVPALSSRNVCSDGRVLFLHLSPSQCMTIVSDSAGPDFGVKTIPCYELYGSTSFKRFFLLGRHSSMLRHKSVAGGVVQDLVYSSLASPTSHTAFHSEQMAPLARMVPLITSRSSVP